MPHNNTAESGPRYTDGINGEDGGKERWLQCVTDCDQADRCLTDSFNASPITFRVHCTCTIQNILTLIHSPPCELTGV